MGFRKVDVTGFEKPTVYWRPGCGFCMMLTRSLKSKGVEFDEINIWESPEGAEFVRKHAGGNEIVPTVAMSSGVMVNPSAKQVISALGAASSS